VFGSYTLDFPVQFPGSKISPDTGVEIHNATRENSRKTGRAAVKMAKPEYTVEKYQFS